MERSPAFEQTKRRYLAEVAALDMGERLGIIGASVDRGGVVVPIFGQPHLVSPDGVFGPDELEADHSTVVVLCRYIIMCPHRAVEGGDEWVTYREFKDAAPFVGGFLRNAEQPLACAFAGKAAVLARACATAGGAEPETSFGAQIARRFVVLPRLPILMLWNDDEEEFSASCSLLFERRAASYLDMECLAIVGWLLADRLVGLAGLSTKEPLSPRS